MINKEESQEFQNMFAALEPQSRKIEAFLNDIEGEIASGSVKDANFAKGFMDGLMCRHDLYLTESEQKPWLDKLMASKQVVVVEDYPALLVPENQEFTSPSLTAIREIIKGGISKGEMVTIMGGGPVGRSHAELLSTISKSPDFLVSSELEVNHLQKHYDKIKAQGFAHNDFIIRGQEEIPDLLAFDSKDRSRVVHSERKILTASQRNKRKSKNKASRKARKAVRN